MTSRPANARTSFVFQNHARRLRQYGADRRPGSVAFTPAGTYLCLLDFTDFPTADPGLITLPSGHGFLVGDVVQFSIEGGATLVGGLTADTDYYIVNITDDKAQVSATAGGTAIDFSNSLSGDTPGGHINMRLTEFTLGLQRDQFRFLARPRTDRNHQPELRLQQHQRWPCVLQDATRPVTSTAPDLSKFSSLPSRLRWPPALSVLPQEGSAWRRSASTSTPSVHLTAPSTTALRLTSKHRDCWASASA